MSTKQKTSVPVAKRLLALQELSEMEFQVLDSQKTKVSGKVIGGSQVAVSYETIAGNSPATYGNFMAIWQDTKLPYVYKDGKGAVTEPIKRNSIVGNTPTGSQPFTGLDVQSKPYIVGYGTGADLTSVCSTVIFLPGGEISTFETTISVESVFTDFITVRFDTPSGNRPKTNNNWIGVWEGTQPAFNCSDYKVKQRVTVDRSRDVEALSFPVRTDTDYTIAYGTGSGCSDIAAYVVIRTSVFMAQG